MENPPVWALALMYWLHMLATVAWIGGLVSISLLMLPAMRKSLRPADQLAFLEAMQKRLEPLAWFCIGLLVTTGLFQLSANQHYKGFFDVSSQWSLAILIKHGLGLILAAVTAVQTWEVLPAIRRVLLQRQKAQDEELNRLLRREERLVQISIGLSILILGATALARSTF